MNELAITVAAVFLAVWVAIVVYAYWLARRSWNDRPMRCPETGSIALVGIDYASARGENAPEPCVQRCSLWPDRAGCARGCLERYHDSQSGFAANLDALRPFRRT